MCVTLYIVLAHALGVGHGLSDEMTGYLQAELHNRISWGNHYLVA